MVFAKVMVKWLNEALCFKKSLVLTYIFFHYEFYNNNF